MHHFVSDDRKLAVVVNPVKLLFFKIKIILKISVPSLTDIALEKNPDQLTKKVNTTVADVVSC